MSNPAEQATRAAILKGTQAQALGSVLISPRHPANKPREDLALSDEDAADLGELHVTLANETESSAAERVADRILAEAQAHREALLSSASQAAEQSRREMERELAAMQEAAELELVAQRAELVEGIRKEVEAEFVERYGTALNSLETAAKQLASRQQEFLEELEEPAFELVLALARQLLGTELRRSPDYLTGLIASALEQLKSRQAARLSLHPDTLDLLLCDDLLSAKLAERGIRLEQLEFSPDQALRKDEFELRAGMALLRFDFEHKVSQVLDHYHQHAAASKSEAGW